LLGSLGVVECMELLLDKLRVRRSNREFLDSINTESM
jgi:transcription termination factor Rho